MLALKGFATEISDNIFVRESRGGVKGLPMSSHKWSKMAKNRIFSLMAGKWETLQFLAILPYLCLLMGDPLTPPLLSLIKMLS